MTGQEWRAMRDRPGRTMLDRDEYELMIARFYKSPPRHRLAGSIERIDDVLDIPHRPDPLRGYKNARARVDAAKLLQSQTDGMLRLLLSGYVVMELEALVLVLER